MIELLVDDFCQDCDGFEPTSHKDRMYSDDEIYATYTIVECVNKRRCRAMYNHILREFNKTKEN